MMRASLVSAGLVALATAGCAGMGSVTRIVDGRAVVGGFVEPDAYAWFLRGVLAEDAGDRKGALVAYREAASRGEEGAEIWARIGSVLCAGDVHDTAADRAFARARAIDPAYAPALAAAARCALLRGDTADAEHDAATAAALDPTEIGPALLLARAEDSRGRSEASRDRIVALTVATGRGAAWDALASWGRGHHDATLEARGLSGVARVDASRRVELARRAAELAGDGELLAARLLAGAVLDAVRSSGAPDTAATTVPGVARLAIDEALLRGDATLALARATTARIGLDAVAARALLNGQRGVARQLATLVLSSDPSATGARMVLAADGEARGDAALVASSLSDALPVRGAVPEEAWLPFARLLALVGSRAAARSFVEQLPDREPAGRDALTTPIAVALGAMGVLPEDALTANARVELAVRRLEAPTAADLAEADARHKLLGLAIAAPLGAEADGLARRLRPAASSDAIVAVALIRMSLARAQRVDPSDIEHLVTRDPADPLVAAVALDVATTRGDKSAILPARARLTALGRTPRELAHALE